ncbi:hypothetical protein J4411_03595 [Candidatus Pacearchaeota archaeon]|nr:hypothetical protein [Candidatus Pacearchaeota archaeon]
MRDSLRRSDGKKIILIILDILFGIYFINSKFPIVGQFDSVSSFNNMIIFLGGILFLLNFLYLLLFARRRIY